VRLIAASDAAPEAVVKRALALPAEAGLDGGTLWASIALARREGADDAALVAFAREHYPDYADKMLAFAEPDAPGPNVEAYFAGFPALLRGHARVMALIVGGQDAPAAWREDVQRLLFAAERPHFEPATDPPPSK